MENYNLMTKTYTIGEYVLVLGITREIAIEGFRKYPKYFELANSDIAKQIGNIDTSKEIEIEKVLELNEFTESITVEQEKIVRYLLPKMIACSGCDCDINLDEFYEYCQENGCLYDFVDEETKEVSKGIFNLIMEFILLGFTNGRKQSKPNIKITIA